MDKSNFMMSYLRILFKPLPQQQKIIHASRHQNLPCKTGSNGCRAAVPLAEESRRLSLNTMDHEADIQGFSRIGGI